MDDYGKTKEELVAELRSMRYRLEEFEKVYQRSKETFQELLEAAPDAVVVINARQKIVLINRQTEAIFDYARTELLGKDLNILLPERFRNSHHHQVTDFMEKLGSRPMGTELTTIGLR